MIIEVGNSVISKIDTLPFLDKYAGIVKTLSLTVVDKDNKPIKKTFPADCQLSLDQCESGRYKDLCPESSKKSVLFLEDNGIKYVRSQGGLDFWKANMNLVCWLNMPLLGFNDCSYSAIAITGILSKLPVTPFNYGNYQRILIKVTGQQSKNINPFQKYTFDETVMQYLMYPYDSFLLNLDVDFAINKRCLEAQNLTAALSCES
jgi:hypothetical protein